LVGIAFDAAAAFNAVSKQLDATPGRYPANFA